MAPRVIQPKFDGFDDLDTGSYDGPNPTPGIYRFKLKKMSYTPITAEGENKGMNRLLLVCEIVSKANGDKTPFKGAALFPSLNETKQGSPYINKFLKACTDGTDEDFAKIREAYWRKPKKIDDVVTQGSRKVAPILQFGSYNVAEGKPVLEFVAQVVERTIQDGPRKGEKTLDISKFFAPLNPKDAESEEDPLANSDEGWSDDDDSGNTEDTGDSSDDETQEDTPAADESSSDSEQEDSRAEEPAADDPWT